MSRGSSAWRAEFWGAGCDPNAIVAASWIIAGGKIQCHRDAVGAFRALGRIFVRFGYAVRRDVTGCYNCRKITGGTAPSAHAQGIALDVNWDMNPYRYDRVVTDMPMAMIEAVEALRTDGGVKAFRWGGDWDGRPETPQSNYDAMHFEVLATPAEIETGFTIRGFLPENRSTWPLLDLGERGDAVEILQDALGLERTASYDALTKTAVRRYQTARGLSPDGVVGYATWTSLLTNAPVLAIGAPKPGKGQEGGN